MHICRRVRSALGSCVCHYLLFFGKRPAGHAWVYGPACCSLRGRGIAGKVETGPSKTHPTRALIGSRRKAPHQYGRQAGRSARSGDSKNTINRLLCSLEGELQAFACTRNTALRPSFNARAMALSWFRPQWTRSPSFPHVV